MSILAIGHEKVMRKADDLRCRDSNADWQDQIGGDEDQGEDDEDHGCLEVVTAAVATVAFGIKVLHGWSGTDGSNSQVSLDGSLEVWVVVHGLEDETLEDPLRCALLELEHDEDHEDGDEGDVHPEEGAEFGLFLCVLDLSFGHLAEDVDGTRALAGELAVVLSQAHAFILGEGETKFLTQPFQVAGCDLGKATCDVDLGVSGSIGSAALGLVCEHLLSVLLEAFGKLWQFLVAWWWCLCLRLRDDGHWLIWRWLDHEHGHDEVVDDHVKEWIGASHQTGRRWWRWQ
mmetsp:Transcript_14873/g.41185  ORF Transcript_14873/g.41185 Transcript_14873/m.41185 type:complete len:287 (+) Transcript_14873:249-1109(+)